MSDPHRGPAWPIRLVRSALAAAWIGNVGLLIAGFAWVSLCGRSIETIEQVQSLLLVGEGGAAAAIRNPSRIDRGATAAIRALIAAAVSMLAMFAGLLAGTKHFRNLRMWLAFTAVACGWLGLATIWPQVHWWGQRMRVGADFAPFAELVRSLHSDWPADDGEHPALGMFIAYPQGEQRTMLMLYNTSIAGSKQTISAIERTGPDVIRFELAGDERGAWLEWRADDSAPEPFTSVLSGAYAVQRAERLAPHWFLVRYRAAATGKATSAAERP